MNDQQSNDSQVFSAKNDRASINDFCDEILQRFAPPELLISAPKNPPKATADVPQCSTTFHDVPKSSAGRALKIDETKPPFRRCSENPLNSRQVAAAQLLALGRTTKAVAQTIGVERHTIARWQRSPDFRAELERQQKLAAALSNDRAPAPEPNRAMTGRLIERTKSKREESWDENQTGSNSSTFPKNRWKTTSFPVF